MKLCIHCVHYVHGSTLCYNPQNCDVSLVDGESHPILPCDYLRENEMLSHGKESCGKDARWFEPKEPTERRAAFPRLEGSSVPDPDYPTNLEFHYGSDGITRLEYFAAAALTGIASITTVDWSDGGKCRHDEGAAKACFDIAEAMCKESERRKAKA